MLKLQHNILCIAIGLCKQFLANVKLDQEHRHSTITTSICCACFQFNVVSCVHVECLDEPRHVGVCAAGSLQTITLLSIPQDIRKHNVGTANIISRLTVVVIANVGRNLVCASCVTWTTVNTSLILFIPSCVCPYMVTWTAMKYRQSIKVNLTNVGTSLNIWLKCIGALLLISSHLSTHLLVADGSM